MQSDVDFDDLPRSIEYHFSRVKNAIDRDWTVKQLPISTLDKDFLRLSVDTLDDGCLINETVEIEGNGPILSNNLETVPRYCGLKMDLKQLMQSRMFKCMNLLL